MGAAKALDKEIDLYWSKLNVHQKEVVLNVVKTLAHDETDWWETVEKEAESSIKKGMKQAKEGKVVSHQEAMKKHKKWLSK